MVCLFCNKTINGNDKTRRCKVSVKYSEENSIFGEVSHQYVFNFWGVGGGKEVDAYLSFSDYATTSEENMIFLTTWENIIHF